MTEQILQRVQNVLEQRKQSQDTANSYSARLFAAGEDAILKKIAEESGELIIAGKNGERAEIIHESADLCFHMLLLLTQNNISIAEVTAELARRQGVSGITEKANRSQ